MSLGNFLNTSLIFFYSPQDLNSEVLLISIFLYKMWHYKDFTKLGIILFATNKHNKRNEFN